jgi:exopolysaccharide biosynthesis protein
VQLQALLHGCAYATNGGPFGGSNCITPVITNGVIVSGLVLPPGFQCVAMLKNGSWALGNVSRALYPSIQNMHCGFQWLVTNGVALASSDLQIAARTAICIDSSGAMISLVAEGSTAAFTGLTLNQTAAWMVELGAVWAINMDGGGSSTSYLESNGGVQGCPTCEAQPYCCSRSVTTITCIF